MIKPTSNANVLYQVGNDYAQAPASAYFKTDSYHDGIYTEVNPDVNTIPSGEKPFSKDGFDDTFFNLKDKAGLNKRTLDVLPQSGWKEPEESGVSGEAYFSDDYATAVVTENV
jgi:hypothetical protein